MINVRWLSPILVVVLSLVLAHPTWASEPDTARQLQSLAHVAGEGQEAAQQNDVARMQAEYEEIHELWEQMEDGIRDQNPTAYLELEVALDAVKDSLQASPSNAGAVQLAYEHLANEAGEIAVKFNEGQAVADTAIAATPADLMDNLDAAHTYLEADASGEALEQIHRVMLAWPAVEGAIAAKSSQAYATIEVELGRANAALKANPPDVAAATVAVEQLRQVLTPFVATSAYTMFDATAIILREGLEAMLVVVALLTFLQRSGNEDKRRWIWAGGILGIVASLITALGLQAIFSYAASGQNREIVEGATSLFAAGMLFYVSYWLHSKSNLGAWQKYINVRTGKALAKGSLVGLALLSFLAVFREGAETAVFFLGMASSIALSDLLWGLGLGVAILAVAALLMFKVGVKLPLRPFFRIAGLLVYYLGFKFLGAGIHALQVAGVLPTTPLEFLPTIPFIGFYPTLETVVPQLLLLAVALGVVFYLRAQEQQTATASATAAEASA